MSKDDLYLIVATLQTKYTTKNVTKRVKHDMVVEYFKL